MKVKKLMTEEVEFCHSEDDLTKAAGIMWRRDCGVVPVIDNNMRVIGMITDRDIAIAACSRDRKPSEIKIGEVTNGKIISCSANDDIKDALKKMRKNQLKRLPVVSQNGALIGILSITDILLENKKVKKPVASTLKTISSPRPIVLSEIAEETPEI